MDNLSYQYSGNRLTALADAAVQAAMQDIAQFTEPSQQAAVEYLYDPNGNIISDLNKGVTISYNPLNKPLEILFTTSPHAGQKILYLYDASGLKLRQTVLDTLGQPVKTTDYVSGLHYENDTLRFAQHAEGRVWFGAAGARYDYALRDHLGNTRVLFSDTDSNGCPEALQVNDYYPFGLGHATGAAAQGADYQYLYNGKELQEELGLGWYDYGARLYQPETGRWNGVDALGEKYYHLTPYRFSGNNPLIYLDPDGNLEGWYVDANSQLKFDERVNSQQQANDAAAAKGDNGYTYLGQNITLGAGESGAFVFNGYADGTGEFELTLGTETISTEAPNAGFLSNQQQSLLAGAGAYLAAREGVLGTVGDVFVEIGENKTFQQVMEVSDKVGKALGVVGAVNSIFEAVNKPTLGNILKAGFDVGMMFTGPVAGLIDAGLELSGAKDAIFEGIDNLFD